MSSVKNFESWILAYKDRKQSTLQMRPTDGALLVVDAKEPSKVLREFPVRRGDDLLTLLQTSTPPTLQAIHAARTEKIEIAKEEVQRIEKQLLIKIEERVAIKDVLPKIEITRKIGELQRDLAKASCILQDAIIPYRSAVEVEVIQNVLDPDTKKLSYKTISIVQTLPYTFEERSIPIATKKA
jgi:hypothetical protein